MEQDKCPLTNHIAKCTIENLAFRWYECPACGTFKISLQASRLIANLASEYRDKRHLLAALARKASDLRKKDSERYQYIIITTESLKDLLDSVSPPRDPYELMDNLLLFAASRASKFLDAVQLDPDIDYPAIYAKDPDELQYALTEALGARLLQRFPDRGYMISSDGWRRVNELRKVSPQSDQAFVAMWFDPSLEAAWDKGFKPALGACSYQPIRIDKEHFNSKIDDQIIADIRRSGLLVADVTGQRQGVYFEVGFALGLGLPVIWTCREDWLDKTHFDTRQYNYIVWKDPDDLQQKLINRIEATLFRRAKR